MTKRIIGLTLITVSMLALAACSHIGRFAAPQAGPLPAAYSGSDGSGDGGGM